MLDHDEHAPGACTRRAHNPRARAALDTCTQCCVAHRAGAAACGRRRGQSGRRRPPARARRRGAGALFSSGAARRPAAGSEAARARARPGVREWRGPRGPADHTCAPAPGVIQAAGEGLTPARATAYGVAPRPLEPAPRRRPLLHTWERRAARARARARERFRRFSPRVPLPPSTVLAAARAWMGGVRPGSDEGRARGRIGRGVAWAKACTHRMRTGLWAGENPTPRRGALRRCIAVITGDGSIHRACTRGVPAVASHQAARSRVGLRALVVKHGLQQMRSGARCSSNTR